MELSEISTKAKSLLVEMFGLSEDSLTREKSINQDLGLDSIDTIDLLTSLNEEFNIDLSPFDFEGCELLGDFLGRLEIKAIERKNKLSSNA